jgi:Outer membrane protein beta-barrel domain
MKNALPVLLFLAMFAAPAIHAQDQPSKLEIYGGYDYVRFNINAKVSGQPPSQTFNANGGGGELIYNFSSWLGVLGDVSGLWATSTSNSGMHGAAIPYLFGPRVNFRQGLLTPFAQVLFGAVTTSSGVEHFGWQTHYAMTAGGGLDVPVSPHFSIRPIQAEYFMTKIPDGINNRQNNFRFGAGVVFRFP